MVYEDLDAVRQQVGLLIPRYNIKKLDPQTALETGVGNCFAKAVIASGIMSLKYSEDPMVRYNRVKHATPKPSMISGRHSKNFAHITVLTADPTDASHPTVPIRSLCFGIEGKSGKKVFEQDEGDILDDNELETYSFYDPNTGAITQAPAATKGGMVTLDWRTGSDQYLEALDRDGIQYEKLFETLLEKLAALGV